MTDVDPDFWTLERDLAALQAMTVFRQEDAREAEAIDQPHPRNANIRWAKYVKLAAHTLDDGPRSDAKMREILDLLTEFFPDEMAPVLAKWDGGCSALRQRLNHMHTPGYENEHPENWPDLDEQNRILVDSGWYHGVLL